MGVEDIIGLDWFDGVFHIKYKTDLWRFRVCILTFSILVIVCKVHQYSCFSLILLNGIIFGLLVSHIFHSVAWFW